MGDNTNKWDFFKSNLIGLFTSYYNIAFKQNMTDSSYFGLLLKVLKITDIHYFSVDGKTNNEIIEIIDQLIGIEFSMEKFPEFGYSGLLTMSGGKLDVDNNIYLQEEITRNKFLLVKGLPFLPIFIRKLLLSKEPYNIDQFSLIITDLRLVCKDNYIVASLIVTLYVIALFLVSGVNDDTKKTAAKFMFNHLNLFISDVDNVSSFNNALSIFTSNTIISNSNVIMLFPFWILCNYSTLLEDTQPNLKLSCEFMRTQTFEYVDSIGHFLNKYLLTLDYSNPFDMTAYSNVSGIQLLNQSINQFINTLTSI